MRGNQPRSEWGGLSFLRSPPFAYRPTRDDTGRLQGRTNHTQANTSQSLREVPMRCKQLTSFLLATTVGMLIAGAASAQVTVFEGARVIVGDGRVLDNTTIVVSGSKITQVGGAAPAGATRVDLSGKTVMPLILDTHTHLSTNRDGL